MSYARSFLALLACAVVATACDPGGGGKVAVSPCANGIQDLTETAIDCGGTCGACPGATCSAPSECASQSCVASACVAPTCNDGVKNGTEVRVDCGGASCGACPPLTCANGRQDAGETGIDCGGACAACGVVTDPCTNGVKDATEDGVDCGGTCAPCGATPTCTDGFKNQDESDIDCGGVCNPCGDGKACGDGGDCVSGSCNDKVCGQAPASCTNGAKDPGEGDVDCGGPCPKCPSGKFCNDHPDCLSATCVFGVCRDPSCADDIQNQGESDVDCGGNKCDPCEDGLTCKVTGDCASEVCSANGRCVSCSDGAKNQDESDVDCGGICDKCPNDQDCGSPADCESNTCVSGVCRPEGTSAGTCTVEADCDSGFFCEYTWNDESGLAAGWDQQCLAERAGGQPGAACQTTDDCAGYGCFNGFCSAACAQDGDCFSGAVCASAEGLFDVDSDDVADVLLPFEYCLGFANGSGACLSQADCGSGKRCTVYLEENLTGASLDPDGPYKAAGRCESEIAGGKVDGKGCETDLECKSGFCSGQGVCSHPCENQSECPPVAVDGLGTLSRVCSARIPWGGGSLEDPTTYVRRSECVALTGTHSLTDCGPTTATPFACAGDEACLSFIVGFGPDVKAKVDWRCLGGTGSSLVGDFCNASSDCVTGICLQDEVNGGGYCSRGCSVANDTCPPDVGLSCKNEVVVERKGKYASNGVSIGLCKR